ncbi:MAG: sodium ion-translocating decarboxylase subunit beta, partial [Bacteroidales bacterium]|nr:sodium ion-translocating decarboxylase subunit beta [Bacteroidales bacterium]
MLGKKSIYRRPVVILASIVVLLLLNLAVVNNPTFATRISDLTEQTATVSEMSVEESNAQLAEMADSMVAEAAKTAESEAQQVTEAAPEAQQTLQASEDLSTKAQLKDGLRKFWLLTGFRNCKIGNLIMILVGILFIFLAVRFEFEPMLLIPIGTGIICGNIPFFQGYGISLAEGLANLQAMMDAGTLNMDMDTAKALLLSVFGDNPGDKHMVLSEAIKSVEHLNMADFGLTNHDIEGVKGLMNGVFQSGELNLQTGLYQKGSVLNYLYFGVTSGVYPPLIFLGIGAMTDFSSLIANPKLMVLGAAAQLGVFITFIGALYLGFNLREAGAIGIIGGADGPTAIFLSSRLANGMNGTRNLIGPIAIAAYSYMALVPVIQPPIIRLMTSKKERLIKMKAPRMVNKTEKIMFPIVGLILTTFISPTALPLLGMLFFG